MNEYVARVSCTVMKSELVHRGVSLISGGRRCQWETRGV